MNKVKILNKTRIRRKNRTRAKIFGTLERPRLSVFRSNRQSYVQLINDEKGETLAGASTNKLITEEKLGELIAEKAVKKEIKKIIFDRRGYKYHGRVKAIAEGARKRGLKF
ncbi:MAG: 50S ribosomal protein L18 [Patescibacteria group bacterium]